MKEYYLNRFRWIFRYTSKNFFYCFGKTVCIIVGLPVYAVCFLLEMVFTLVNMLFSWIPGFNIIIGLLCKLLVALFGSAFYLCVLTDLKKFSDKLPADTLDEIENADESATDISKSATAPKDNEQPTNFANEDSDLQ